VLKEAGIDESQLPKTRSEFIDVCRKISDAGNGKYFGIIDSGAKSILLHKENATGNDYSIIYNTLQKDPCNSEKEAVVYIYRQLRNSEPPDEATARDVIDKLFFSDKRYDLGEVGRFRINKKLELDIDPQIRVLTKEDMIAIIKKNINITL